MDNNFQQNNQQSFGEQQSFGQQGGQQQFYQNQPYDTSDAQFNQQYMQPTKKNGIKIVIIVAIILFVVCCCGIGGLAYIGIKSNEDKDKKDTKDDYEVVIEDNDKEVSDEILDEIAKLPEDIAPTDDSNKNNTNNDAHTDSYISAEASASIDSIDTDYKKVKWGVQYSPDGMDGLVISVTPYFDGNTNYLILGLTNLYSEDITVSASGYVNGANGEDLGKVSIYDTAIRPGNTTIHQIFYEGESNGSIHWDNIELPKVFEESTYWEADWALGADSDGYAELNYTLNFKDTGYAGYIWALVLDENGYVIGYAQDYNSDKGNSASGTIKFYKNDFGAKVGDVALFSNPEKE